MDDKNWISFQVDDETNRKLDAIIKHEERNRSDTLRRLVAKEYDALFVSIPKVGTINGDGTITIREELDRR